MDSNNKKALLLLVPAAVILILVVVAKTINKPKATSDSRPASFIDPNLNHVEDTINSKQGVYAHGQQIEEQKRNEKKVNFDDLGEMAKNNAREMGYSQDTSSRGSSRLYNVNGSIYDSKALQKNVVKAKSVTGANPELDPSSYIANNQKQIKTSIPPQAASYPSNTAAAREYSDISVYGVKKSASNNNFKNQNEDFFPAYLEEDTKITDKAAVVFILDKDCIINGTQISKNSLLFGTVVNASSRFDIFIHNVKNTDGATLNLNNVVVFNEKYGRGIVPEGNVSKALKQSAGQSAVNATGDLGYSTNTAVNLAQQGLSNTVNALTGSRNPSITLSQGYRVFIKEIR